MSGDIGWGLIPVAPLFIYAVAGLSMLAMGAWLIAGGRSIELDAATGGVLTVGTFVSAIVGVGLLPFSIIASFFFLIGLLEFAGDALIARAVRTFEVSSSLSARHEAVEDLARWRGVLPDRVIAKRSMVALARTGGSGEFVRTYREVTGVDLFASGGGAD